MFTNGEANPLSGTMPGTVGTNSTKYVVLYHLGSSVQRGDIWVRELLIEGILAYVLNYSINMMVQEKFGAEKLVRLSGISGGSRDVSWRSQILT